MTIVERIKLECKKNDTNVTSIEKKIGLSTGAIGKWNNSNPSADSLYNVAQLLDCSMEYLLTGKEKFKDLSKEEQEWLDLYSQLSSENSTIKNECIGFVKGYIAGNQKNEKK